VIRDAGLHVMVAAAGDTVAAVSKAAMAELAALAKLLG